jgi:hypothetical protein
VIPQGNAENALRPIEEACQRPVSSGAKGCNGSILLKNSILQEHEFLANAQCISQLALRIAEAVAKCAVVARNNQLRGPPRLKMRDASMGLEILAQVRKGRFSTE